MLRRASLLFLPLLATACASVPKAPPEMDRLAKEFRTTPGKSSLYLFRDEGFGAAVKMSVVLDGQMLGDTAAKTFLLATIEPGSHTLVSKAENDARLDFVAEPGKNIFVWQEVRMGLLKARSQLHLVDEASAKSRINECSLSQGEPLVPPRPAPQPTKDPAPVPSA